MKKRNYKRVNKADRNKIFRELSERELIKRIGEKLFEKNKIKQQRREVMEKMGMLKKDIDKLLDY